ncbi:hypothetical protein FHS21_005881 [Phyllobacterium trifolii]|uniref:Uncharacterized protein n=1 Tax=Phyllobacterium trifolii TaxID=300193 RepID=A0A839UE89_9HYPH|nr:hypothetical protein [Phyllobacterium trifolii]
MYLNGHTLGNAIREMTTSRTLRKLNLKSPLTPASLVSNRSVQLKLRSLRI